jgi:hypothetical protein
VTQAVKLVAKQKKNKDQRRKRSLRKVFNSIRGGGKPIFPSLKRLINNSKQAKLTAIFQ